MTSTTEPIPLHNDPNSAYHGPTMGYLIAHNLLGHQIIKSFADRPIDGDILDNEELARLRCAFPQFLAYLSAGTKTNL